MSRRRLRRAMWRLALAVAAIGCAATLARAQSSPHPDITFDAFLAELRREASSKGIAPGTLDRALASLTPDGEVLDLLGRQPEHERTAGQYVTLLVSPERIANGRAKLDEQAATLAAAETRFGVDRHVIAAVWGVETGYGHNQGGRSVIRSLASLAHADSRRPQFWRAELLAALRILQNGDIAADRMTGSWAGAMGHTQFMPTTYVRHAVDLDGDGRRDIWGSPADALGSTAAYLSASGWTRGQPWGFAVQLPAGFDYGLSAPGAARRAAEWQAAGVSPMAGQAWPPTSGDLALLLPAGAAGPAFLVTGNFRAILRYNASTAYALAIGMLAGSLATGELPATRWPDGDKALSRPEREELQRLLSALGHDTGQPDGIIGGQTRAAIRAFQRKEALPEDGHPSPGLLERVRAPRG